MEDKSIVEYVADLARINLKPEEKEFIGSQLTRILGYIDKLKELEVKDIEPMRGLHLDNNIFRKDKAIASGCREDILKNAPLREGDYFKILKVI